MTRLTVSIVVAVVLALAALTPVLAHEGGHAGGCAAFGQLNRAIGQDPDSFGFVGYRNLGEIISDFAQADDGVPGVGDIVETIDHAACG